MEDDFSQFHLLTLTQIISIHVLRMEDDRRRQEKKKNASGISIHVLRMEDDYLISAHFGS